MFDFLVGFSYPWQGLKILFQPRYRRLAWWPVVINVVLFSATFYYLAVLFNRWLDSIFSYWWMEWLEWLLWPLFVLLIMSALVFGFARLANLIGVLFNARLCQALMQARPEDPLTQAAERQTWRNNLRMIGHEVKKLSYFLLWFVPLTFLSSLPGIGMPAQIVLLYLGIYWCALEYMDYPLSEAGFSLPKVRQRLAHQRMLTLGFGTGQLLLSLTPLVNLLAIPVGVAAATRMCQEQPPQDKKELSALKTSLANVREFWKNSRQSDKS